MASKPISLEFVKNVLKRQPKGHVAAFYAMKKPSDLSPVYAPSRLPLVRLEVIRVRNDYLFSVMLKIQHKNILRVEAIKEEATKDDKLIAVFVEPYDGHLIAYLEHLVADNTTLVIPSEAFRDLIRQVIEGIEELRINGVYHGAISIENIYYVIADHVPVVKLANFRQLIDTDLEIAQLRDWVGLGNVLAYISNAARRLQKNFSLTMIDRLASKLQGLTDTALLPDLKKEILEDPFFWGKPRRMSFYIHDMVEAVKDASFVQSVEDMNWSLPWKNNPHNGLIAGMDEYRRTDLNMDPYDGSDPVANIKCMSGAYTHQDKLKGKIRDTSGNLLSVDSAIQKNQPDLCLTLYRLRTGEIAAEAAAAAAAEEAPPGDAEMNE